VDRVTLDATLESNDDDGVVTLRWGLVLVDAEGTPPAIGTTVRVRLVEMMLSDTGN
jgi:hypothetical protein